MSNKISGAVLSFVYAISNSLVSRADSLRMKALRGLSAVNQLRVQILYECYAVWQGRGVLAARGFTARGGALSAGVNKGVLLIIEVILLSISGQFIVAFVPSTLTGFATAALTSVSTSVQTIFQQGLSLTFIAVIILLYIGVLVETFRAY